MGTLKIRQKFHFRDKQPSIDKAMDISSDFDSISQTSDDINTETIQSPRGSIISSSSTYIFNIPTTKEDPLPMKLASNIDSYMPKTPDSTVITLCNSKKSAQSSQLMTFRTKEMFDSSSLFGEPKLSCLKNIVKSPKKSPKFLSNVQKINFYGMNNDQVAGINFSRPAAISFLNGDAKFIDGDSPHSSNEMAATTFNNRDMCNSQMNVNFVKPISWVKPVVATHVEDALNYEIDEPKVTPVILRKKSTVDENLSHNRQSKLKLKRLNSIGDCFDRKLPAGLVKPMIAEKPSRFKKLDSSLPVCQNTSSEITANISTPMSPVSSLINYNTIDSCKPTSTNKTSKNQNVSAKPKINNVCDLKSSINSKVPDMEVNNNYILERSCHKINDRKNKPKFPDKPTLSITQKLTASAQRFARLSPSLKPKKVKDLIASFNVVNPPTSPETRSYLRHSVDYGSTASKAKSNNSLNELSKVKRNSWTPPNTRETPKETLIVKHLSASSSKPCISKRFSSECNLNISVRSHSSPQIDLQSISDELNKRFLEKQISSCSSTTSSSTSDETKSSTSDECCEGDKNDAQHSVSVVNIIADSHLVGNINNKKRSNSCLKFNNGKTRQFLYVDSNNKDVF